MAITIIQDPQAVMPVYNNIVFTVNSTNKTQCSFRYICDIYVNGTYVTRIKLFPKGTNGYAEFKVNRVLEDFVSYDLHSNLYGLAVNDDSICSYVLKFGEEYDTSSDCNQETTVYPDLTVTSTFYAWNAALQYREWKDFDYTDYEMNASSKRFLTNAPSGHLIRFSDQATINFFNLTSSVIDYVRVITYDSNDSVLGSFAIDNPYSTVTVTSRRLLTLGVGPDNLNNTTLSSTYLTDIQPVITSSVAYYTVTLWNDASPDLAVSETYRYDIDVRHSRFENKRFWWLNRLGGFDSYSFTLRNTKRVSANRQSYNKLIGSLDGTEWTYDVGDRGKTVLGLTSIESGSALSNWLTEDESLWMEELFTSPEVYISDNNGDGCAPGNTGVILNLDPIVITSTNFEEKVKKTVKNINYTIDYEKAYENNIQRG